MEIPKGGFGWGARRSTFGYQVTSCNENDGHFFGVGAHLKKRRKRKKKFCSAKRCTGTRKEEEGGRCSIFIVIMYE
jgi:hypothetical protein